MYSRPAAKKYGSGLGAAFETISIASGGQTLFPYPPLVKLLLRLASYSIFIALITWHNYDNIAHVFPGTCTSGGTFTNDPASSTPRAVRIHQWNIYFLRLSRLSKHWAFRTKLKHNKMLSRFSFPRATPF